MDWRLSMLLTACLALSGTNVVVAAVEADQAAEEQPAATVSATAETPNPTATEDSHPVETAKLERLDVSPKLAIPPASAETGFVSLLAAEGLDGWGVQEGKLEAWKRDGDMISCMASGGGWLRSEQEYSDFVLKFDYRLEPGGNSGVGLRAPAEGNPTFTGLEIQLLDDSSPKYADLRPDQYTGSVYYQVPPARKSVLNPPGEWNSCLIRCVGEELEILINNQQVNEVSLIHTHITGGKDASQRPRLLTERPPLGHVSLQSHTTRVDFRGLHLKDLTVQNPSGLKYVDLVQGDGDPTETPSTVTVHYAGQLTNGKRFTDTRDVGEPVTFPLDKVIPGLREGLQGMKAGGKRRIIVPPDLAYGHPGVQNLVPPDSTLIFEVELFSFER